VAGPACHRPTMAHGRVSRPVHTHACAAMPQWPQTPQATSCWRCRSPPTTCYPTCTPRSYPAQRRGQVLLLLSIPHLVSQARVAAALLCSPYRGHRRCRPIKPPIGKTKQSPCAPLQPHRVQLHLKPATARSSWVLRLPSHRAPPINSPHRSSSGPVDLGNSFVEAPRYLPTSSPTASTPPPAQRHRSPPAEQCHHGTPSSMSASTSMLLKSFPRTPEPL
jgi:hypothetical protein